jgi:hypothetical protein
MFAVYETVDRGSFFEFTPPADICVVLPHPILGSDYWYVRGTWLMNLFANYSGVVGIYSHFIGGIPEGARKLIDDANKIFSLVILVQEVDYWNLTMWN